VNSLKWSTGSVVINEINGGLVGSRNTPDAVVSCVPTSVRTSSHLAKELSTIHAATIIMIHGELSCRLQVLAGRRERTMQVCTHQAAVGATDRATKEWRQIVYNGCSAKISHFLVLMNMNEKVCFPDERQKNRHYWCSYTHACSPLCTQILTP
jgi:hypothetical protein